MIENPSLDQLENAVGSLHAVFNKTGKLLAVQSEGNFQGQLVNALHKAANSSKPIFELFEEWIEIFLS